MSHTKTPATREEVYQAIDGERDYQQAMASNAHGDPTNDRTKSLEEFALYIQDYTTELVHQLARTWGPDAYAKPLDTLRKVAALAVAAMEVWGAPKRTAPTKHKEGTDLT
jgi:hypothetical protein